MLNNWPDTVTLKQNGPSVNIHPCYGGVSGLKASPASATEIRIFATLILVAILILISSVLNLKF